MSINKNGNLYIDNIYEHEAMSIYCDTNGKIFRDTIGYTPTTIVNSCLTGHLVTIEPNVKYYIECTLTWNGFSKTNSDGNTFDMWFQGSVNNVWTYTNPMTTALNSIKRPSSVVLSATSGSYRYKTTFISTDTEIKTLHLGLRSDNSNGTGTVSISDVLIIPEKYYISDKIKARFSEEYISCKEIIEL